MATKDDNSRVGQSSSAGQADSQSDTKKSTASSQQDISTARGADLSVDIALPVEAEDTDLIEKEWVEIAKQIVEHTRDDPYEQQRALSQMKADYLKKRYNKDLKMPEE